MNTFFNAIVDNVLLDDSEIALLADVAEWGDDDDLTEARVAMATAFRFRSERAGRFDNDN